jgi:hypothetical protein
MLGTWLSTSAVLGTQWQYLRIELRFLLAETSRVIVKLYKNALKYQLITYKADRSYATDYRSRASCQAL